MFNISLFVDIFFRLLNFAILIFILRYIFKQYILEGIKKKIQDRRDYMRGLEEHLRAVSYQRDLLMNTIDQEYVAGAQIEKKIVRWADALTAERKLRAREKEAIMRKVAANTTERETALQILQARMAIMPDMIDTVEQSLQTELADPKLSGMVTRRIIQTIKAKNHG